MTKFYRQVVCCFQTLYDEIEIVDKLQDRETLVVDARKFRDYKEICQKIEETDGVVYLVADNRFEILNLPVEKDYRVCVFASGKNGSGGYERLLIKILHVCPLKDIILNVWGIEETEGGFEYHLSLNENEH